MLRSLDVLSPKICLHTDDVGLLLFRQVLCVWLIGVALLHREVASYAYRLVSHVGRLTVIEVEICVWSHYGIMSEPCGLYATSDTAP